jgi:large subunit ribosomal protein L4
MTFKMTVLDDTMTNTQTGFESLESFEPKYILLSEVIRAELSNLRAGNAHTKTKGEVRGGGKKPWKQKHTGRARHGSSRSPIWKGGGVTFGPRNIINWHLKINKSAKVSALKTILKDRLQNNMVYILPAQTDLQKTKQASTLFDALSEKTQTKTKRNILVYTREDKPLIRGVVNTDNKMINAENIKITVLANSLNLILTQNAKTALEAKITKVVKEAVKTV